MGAACAGPMTRSNLTVRSLLALLAVTLGTVAAGCGTSGAASSTGGGAEPGPPPIAILYRSRCGACHRPVAPGSEPADKLHAALLEHRKRTRLTEAQWSDLEAFLAPGASAH
jgi:hypothetical protein